MDQREQAGRKTKTEWELRAFQVWLQPNSSVRVAEGPASQSDSTARGKNAHDLRGRRNPQSVHYSPPNSTSTLCKCHISCNGLVPFVAKLRRSTEYVWLLLQLMKWLKGHEEEAALWQTSQQVTPLKRVFLPPKRHPERIKIHDLVDFLMILCAD